MATYLNYLDTLKEEYIQSQVKSNFVNYPLKQFHFYQDIAYVVSEDISFCQGLQAVKLANTAILLVDCNTNSRVYFTDADICSIIASINDYKLKEYIVKHLSNIISGNDLDILSFNIKEKSFEIKGIPFNTDFNHVTCKNPADINMNGNDLIALINLILEKDRTDRDLKKSIKTATKYIGRNCS